MEMTPEFERGLKLESIFMPHAKVRREEFLKNMGTTWENQLKAQAPLRFVHYTSAEAALSIIGDKRVWMRNTTCMSDFREVEHGFDIYRSFFSDNIKAKPFYDALDACHVGAAKAAIDRFDEWWKFLRHNTYIASLSEHDSKEDNNGRLSMWRAFGGTSARVAIVLNVPWFTGGLQSLNVSFSPVSYLDQESGHGILQDVIRNILTNIEFLRSIPRDKLVYMVFEMCRLGITCLKHEGFREEREWRAIYSPDLRTSEHVECLTKVVAGTPQLIYSLPLEAKISPALEDLDFVKLFDRLIIGPTQFPSAIGSAFVKKLTSIGVQDAHLRVQASNIPIRT